MKKVWIEPGCITCGACEFNAPQVFEVKDISYVKADADLQATTDIKLAALQCPVNVIKYQE